MSNPNDETRLDIPVVPMPPPPPPSYPPPPGNYYPPLPPPSPQLPDFKPHRMSMLDKVLAWIMAFVVLVFGMVLAAHFLLKPATTGTPAPHATTSSSQAHHTAKTKAACPSPT